MHVRSSSVVFTAQHQFQRQHRVRAVENPNSDASVNKTNHRVTQNKSQPFTSLKPNNAETNWASQYESVDAELLIIKHILEAFLGQEIVLAQFNGHSEPNTEAEDLLEPTAIEPAPAQWVHLSLQEKEVTGFAMRAEITLANGKTRQVTIDQTMARRLSVEVNVSDDEAARIIDPLVINFSGPVKLSNERVEFDLNADGNKESIASFASNSAYIALDRNGDGKINDGKELFGALTGDGFAELASFDVDGNGFIDSGDPVYAQLLVFDPSDKQTHSLSAKGVEALYLEKAITPFALKDGLQELGFVRSTGFYLTDKGAGTLQQIDLVV